MDWNEEAQSLPLLLWCGKINTLFGTTKLFLIYKILSYVKEFNKLSRKIQIVANYLRYYNLYPQ